MTQFEQVALCFPTQAISEANDAFARNPGAPLEEKPSFDSEIGPVNLYYDAIQTPDSIVRADTPTQFNCAFGRNQVNKLSQCTGTFRAALQCCMGVSSGFAS
jgi:hypothetical protein